ncbi:MAG: metallophosphoesterase [Ilumatobacter sp.]|uniref:metallophosphoesterase n=1 Tax=Ilumatobacter sp. TaxID=1967498 RepID=UPI003297EAF3
MAAPVPSVPPVLIGQLTDTHVLSDDETTDRDVDNNARLTLAVESMVSESPTLDAVLVTGDLTDTSHPHAFETLVGALDAFLVPVLVLPGNHDTRAETRRAFPDMGWIDADHLSWVHEIRGVRLIGLDSTRPRHHGAEFDGDRAEFLSSVLGERHDGPTILAMHHPPFATGIDWMDRAGFIGLDRFADVLAAHPGTVDTIVCGHLHRPISSVVAGVPVQVGLAPVQHVALDLDADAGPAVIHDPIGYQIHLVAAPDRTVGATTAHGVGRVVTHTRYIGTGETPFVPSWAADHDPTAPF